MYNQRIPVSAQEDPSFVPEPVNYKDTRGIVSICVSVLAVLSTPLPVPFLNLALAITGFVLGLTGMSKAKRAGARHVSSKVGMIIGVVGIIIGLFYLGFTLLIILSYAYGDS